MTRQIDTPLPFVRIRFNTLEADLDAPQAAIATWLTLEFRGQRVGQRRYREIVSYFNFLLATTQTG
jgi:hypothetical protein